MFLFCYFGYNRKSKPYVVFPEIIFVIRSVPHSPDLPVSLSPTYFDLSSDSQELSSEETEILYTNQATDIKPQKFMQNDFACDLNLSKQSAQTLVSRLKNKNLLASGTIFSRYRNRKKEFTKHFCKNLYTVLIFPNL